LIQISARAPQRAQDPGMCAIQPAASLAFEHDEVIT
jgi:hypothetical protein